MAKSEKGKKIMNMIYGIGASVVIMGALFKLMHWPGGNAMLIAGLLTEACIFFIAAFEAPEEELDWSLVYPELKKTEGLDDEEAYPHDRRSLSSEPIEGLLSDKINAMFESAKIDQELMDSLAESMRSFESVARSVAQTTDVMSSTNRYSEELALAADRVSALNSVYKIQLENTTNQAIVNEEFQRVSSKIQEEMDVLSNNLYSLNTVYGNMLSAMGRK